MYSIDHYICAFIHVFVCILQDKLARIHVAHNQKVYITSVDNYLPVSLVVYDGGVVTLPSEVTIYNVQIDVMGTIDGCAQELTLVYARMNLYETASTLNKEAGQFVFPTTTLTLMTGADLRFMDTSQYNMEVKNLITRAGSKIEATDLVFTISETCESQEGSEINLNNKVAAQSGNGYVNDRVGSGHGGEGGKGNDPNHVRGPAYDNFFRPEQAGSGGYLTKGGGMLSILATGLKGNIIIDGKIEAK